MLSQALRPPRTASIAPPNGQLGTSRYTVGATGAISSNGAVRIPALAKTQDIDTPAVQQSYSAEDPRRSEIEGLMGGGGIGGMSDENVKYLFYAGAAFVIYYVFLKR